MSTTPLPIVLTAQPDHVHLELRSTVNDSVISSHDPEPDTMYMACIGQFTMHLVEASLPILGVHFVIGGGGPVANYVATVNTGTVLPVTPVMLVANPLTFVFSAAGPAVVGVYVTTEYGTTYLMNNFMVTAPQGYFTSMTGQVRVAADAAGTFLRFTNDAPLAGIVMTPALTGTQSAAGSVAVFQIATNHRFRTDTDHQPWHWSLNGQDVLDIGMTNTVEYQNVVGQLQPGGIYQNFFTDSPAMQLIPAFPFASVGDGQPLIPETYNAYLMFQPAGGIWVPLSVMTWTWAGFAQFEQGAWSAAQDAQNILNPVGVPTNTFPTWTQNTQNGQWVAGLRARML